VTIAATLGVSIALGTDWIYTGSTNVLRELACADSLNSAKFGRFFSDFELWSMVTTNAAKSAGALDVIGTLAPGRRADIAIFDASGRDAHRAVIEAAPSDVQLVLRDGKPLYGDAALMGALVAGACSDLDVCGSAKQVCTPLGGFTFDDLAAANADLYPPFYCGVPEGEPTCTPQRSTSIAGSSTYDGVPTDADADSDGIDDEDDTCPAVFDPIRPVDEGAQPDTDGDGTGDACDSTPL
jgi:hypothetical protein